MPIVWPATRSGSPTTSRRRACGLSWAALEHDARAALGARRAALLEAVGVIAGEATGDDDAALVARRRQQLGALEALQAHVEMRIAELAGADLTSITLCMPSASCDSGVPANNEQ